MAELFLDWRVRADATGAEFDSNKADAIEELSWTQVTPGYATVYQTFSTTEADVTFPSDITGNGLVIIINLDATNDFNWGVKDTTMKQAGVCSGGNYIPAIFEMLGTATLRGAASAGSVNVMIHRFMV